jgi:hypothetical protein
VTNKPKRQSRARDWRHYNAALVRRGSLTLWLDSRAVAAWRERRARVGRRRTNSDVAGREHLDEIDFGNVHEHEVCHVADSDTAVFGGARIGRRPYRELARGQDGFSVIEQYVPPGNVISPIL